MRLQQYLAQAGVASRRRSEEFILAGRVEVNGQTVRELGTQVNPEEDEVYFDGRLLQAEQKVYLRFFKPPHVVSSSFDPEGRETVQAYFKGFRQRVYNVGRLDFDTEGILLMSNDGALSHALMHPSHEVEKSYFVICRGHLDEQELSLLRKGIELEGKKTAPAEVELLEQMRSTTRLRITIHEGRNRQVRRMFEALGHGVSFLRRERFANLTLEGLRPGQWKVIEGEELAELKRLAFAKKGSKAPKAAQKPAPAQGKRPDKTPQKPAPPANKKAAYGKKNTGAAQKAGSKPPSRRGRP